MAVTTTNLGVITAYGDAVAAGYTGTKAEWQALMASYATVGQQAVDAKNAAVAAKDTAVAKATEATTAASTATTKANEASASAQSIAQSAAQIQENTDDIDQLKSEIADKTDTADMLKAFPTDIASGSVASFADGANVPVKSLIVNIDPVQSGSGDPSPTNVRPISGWSEVNVEHTGKNLLDANSVESGVIGNNGILVVSGEVIASKGDGAVSFTTSADWKGVTTDYIPVVGNQAYNISNVGTVAYYLWAWHDASKNFISREASSASTLSATKTAPSNARYLRLTLQEQSAGTFNLSKIQLEFGTTATTYEPYQSTPLNIALGQTVYGGKLDVLSGVLTVDRMYQKVRDIDWSMYSVAQGNLFRSVELQNSDLEYDFTNIVCSEYQTVKASQRAEKTISCGSNYKVDIIDSNYSDADSFKTAKGDVEIVYKFASSITYQLTPHEVTALFGSNNIWADTGDSTLEYRADPTLYIQRLTEPDADMVADSNITSGQYFMVGNTLYKATANIASGATISPNVNCTRKSLSEALNELNA